MKKEIDARKLNCPLPVIKLKNAIDEGALEVEIIVDNEVANLNIEKFAKSNNLTYKSDKKSENEYFITVKKENLKNEENELVAKKKNVVIVIASDKMGDGEEELGKNLLKAFIYTLTQKEDLPSTIVFYNRGAFITTKSDSIEDLKVLEEEGVEIITCGACLKFYKLEEELKAGTVSNMYEILDKQMNADLVIRV